MGDKITIPRSYAGKIGVADCQDSIMREHSLLLLQVTNSTTGKFLGNSTTAPTLFARNVTLEKVMFSFWLQSTATTGTTLLAFRIMKGDSTIYQSKKINSTTQLSTTGWWNYSGTPTITNLSSSDGIYVYITSNSPAAQVKKLQIRLRFKERLDS